MVRRSYERWVRHATHWYVLDWKLSLGEAHEHALRLMGDMLRDYGERAKYWTTPREAVSDDVSYWS